MSWLFSQALVAAYSEDISLDGAQSALWNGTHTQRASWLPAKTTDTCCLSRSGMTFKHLTEDHGEELLTWFQAGFRAKTYQQPGRVQESTVKEAACGDTWRELCLRLDHNSFSLKTVHCLWDEDLELSSVTYPRWGMTLNGELWERTIAPVHTKESESGFWPTPRCQMNRGICWDRVESGNHKSNIEDFVAIKEGLTRGSGRWSLNPEWCEWLMAWPLGWTDAITPLATDKFQQWQLSHGVSLADQ